MPQYADKERFDRAINTLIVDGLCWEDDQNPGEVAYWFPSLMTKSGSQATTEDLKLLK